MKIEEFDQRLRDSVLIADGAMGSLLYETLGQMCIRDRAHIGPKFLAVRGATLLFCVAEFISERAMTARPSES